MKKPIFLTAALAAALTSFAAQAFELPSLAQGAVASIQKTALTVNAIDNASTDAQQRTGFPAVVTASMEVTPRGRFHSIITRYATENGVPVELAHAVISVESQYRPNVRGSAGEVGLMQIKPSTARGLGFAGSVKALYDPETNIRFGMKYLGMARKLGGGTTCGTILKYNAGHNAKRMNPVSRRYCGKVMALLEQRA
jgi:soluble lytic murein transglycosylase-like protein